MRILVLAHRFPPTGGAGVQRNLQLARHLHDVGCRPVIVSGPGPVDDRWLPEDSGLMAEGLDVRVLRVGGPEPTPTPRAVRLERWLRVPTRWRDWWRDGALGIARAAGDVDVVHASIAPFAAAEAAATVARALRAPLVLDLEDPWALDEMLVYPTRIHRRLEVRRMRRALRAGDAIVMNTPEARARVLDAFPELDPGRVVAIPNAFDPLDFASPPPVRHDDAFRIVHTGSLHTDLGRRHRAEGRWRRALGGAEPGVDFLTRSHVFLLEAVQTVLRERPKLGPRVEVVLAGVFTDADRSEAARYPFVRLHDFVSHDHAIALMRSADLLFLPLHDLPTGRRSGIVPHKTYEYLAAGRPILAAVPDGDLRDLLEAAESPRLCRPADVRAMAAAIGEELDRKGAGLEPPAPKPEVIERCTCTRLVRDLASVYELVAAEARGRYRAAPS